MRWMHLKNLRPKGPQLMYGMKSTRITELPDPWDDWQIRAACAKTKTPDAWFPGKGESTKAAKAICRECPVKQKCLDYAIAHREKGGIWGGMTENERDDSKNRDESAA